MRTLRQRTFAARTFRARALHGPAGATGGGSGYVQTVGISPAERARRRRRIAIALALALAELRSGRRL